MDTRHNKVDEVANIILKAAEKSILVVAGAGISVSAGIPDFRTPGSGLYHRLGAFNLPEPKSMFNIEYIPARPRPMYYLMKYLVPRGHKPTLTHYFLRLLDEKNLLRKLITQNIDSLEEIAGIDNDHILMAHGTFMNARCVSTHFGVGCETTKLTSHALLAASIDGSVCACPSCGAPLLPTIVLFGEALPPELGKLALIDAPKSNIHVAIGTGMNVKWVCGMINQLGEDGKQPDKILINRFAVADFKEEGEEPKSGAGNIGDIEHRHFLEGDADDICLELADKLGWKEELLGLKEKRERELDAAKSNDDEDFMFPPLSVTTKTERERLEREDEMICLFPPALSPQTSISLASLEKLLGSTDRSTSDVLDGISPETEADCRTCCDLLTRLKSAGVDAGSLALGYSSSAQVDFMRAEIDSRGVKVFEVTTVGSAPPSRELGKGGPRDVILIQPTEERNFTNEIYKPLLGHWSSYCSRFVGLVGEEPSSSAGRGDTEKDFVVPVDPWDATSLFWTSALSVQMEGEATGSAGSVRKIVFDCGTHNRRTHSRCDIIPDECMYATRAREIIKHLQAQKEKSEAKQDTQLLLSSPPGQLDTEMIELLRQTEHKLHVGCVRSSVRSRVLMERAKLFLEEEQHRLSSGHAAGHGAELPPPIVVRVVPKWEEDNESIVESVQSEQMRLHLTPVAEESHSIIVSVSGVVEANKSGRGHCVAVSITVDPKGGDAGWRRRGELGAGFARILSRRIADVLRTECDE